METKIYTTIDRHAQRWPSGQWDAEPDKVQWPDEATGLPCLAVRHGSSGHWCGYVGVAPQHPLYGANYEDVEVAVHYGLTFSEKCNPAEMEATGICHVPGPGEPGHVWWFGFDCAHHGDHSPQDVMYAKEQGYPFNIRVGESEYRPLSYVQEQCAELAAQLAQHYPFILTPRAPSEK